MLNLKDKYRELISSGGALVAMNFYNLETLRGILSAAKKSNAAIILQASPGTLNYIGDANATAKIAKALVESFGVQAWLHLDHATSLETVKSALDAGFDSVMYDGSALPYEENLEATKEAVAMASWKNVPVEAELGFVPKLGEEQKDDGSGFTSPAQAKKFAEETGIDALAVAIGTAHGFYREKPQLDFERLRAIREILPNTALVLHGSSGLPDADVRKAIEFGINKVNVATELKDAFMRELKSVLQNSDEIDIRKVFPKATEKVTVLAEKKIGLAQ